ncbi:MAG: bifunctional folylpolyglutamate synthase/dihydrofolate synthase [Saprospiraceae bacterium]|nr:bifunctional folylpolyglutamate synthase/dihydrofolate synthase [Pyrinomonadaceae bacterium]
MDFAESTKYLLSLGNEVSAMKLGLENIRTLLAALDDPQNNFLKVQVAGTNGKGSVCAFLDSMCVRAGIKTGLFTSPHLISITERIKIGGVEISEADFALHATRVREICELRVAKGELEAIPTFFEQITAIALSVFAEEEIELAILETGLGGRLDATTAANAEIVAITQIDYDHQEYLGDTLVEIAAEKAAIIRSDTKVVVAKQKREAELVIRGRCREAGVEPNFAKSNYPNVVLGLLGKHQQANAAVAIAIVQELRELNFIIPDDKMRTGLETARHPGRLEYFENFLFDGAHNIAGASALREYLDEFVKQPITMIFGAMKGKDAGEIASVLFPKIEILILTKPENTRALEAAEILNMIPDQGLKKVVLTGNVAEAIKIAREVYAPDGLICVTGSLYLVGEAKKILNN